MPRHCCRRPLTRHGAAGRAERPAPRRAVAALRPGSLPQHGRHRHRVAASRDSEDAADGRRTRIARERTGKRFGIALRRYLTVEIARGEVKKIGIGTLDEIGADAPTADLEVAAAILHLIEKHIIAAVGAPGVGRTGSGCGDEQQGERAPRRCATIRPPAHARRRSQAGRNRRHAVGRLPRCGRPLAARDSAGKRGSVSAERHERLHRYLR